MSAPLNVTHAGVPLVAFIEVTAVRDAIVDPGTFTEWTNDDLNLDVGQPIGSQDYAANWLSPGNTGAEESVCVGTARIGGVDVAVILGDFAFLAGSVGRLACQRVIAAFARARREGLPVFASPASGGTRMQEGRPPSCSWQTSPRALSGIVRPVCHSSCGCAIQRLAESWRPGGR